MKKKLLLCIIFWALPLAFAKADNDNFFLHVKGKILMQVEEKGKAWYVNPADGARYYLGKPKDAFQLMKELSLGVKHDFIKKYSTYPQEFSGRILLDVDDKGKAYYINPLDCKGYSLGKPEDAFILMKKLGLGIKNSDIDKIPLAAKEIVKASINEAIEKKLIPEIDLASLNNVEEEKFDFRLGGLGKEGNKVVFYAAKDGSIIFLDRVDVNEEKGATVMLKEGEAKNFFINAYKEKVENFAMIWSMVKEGALYNIRYRANDQDKNAYMAEDGSSLFLGAINLGERKKMSVSELSSFPFLYIGESEIKKFDSVMGYMRHYPYAPMVAYSEITGKGMQDPNSGKREGGNAGQISYYTQAPAGDGYAYRKINKDLNGKAIFSVVRKDQVEGKWDYADQIIFSPDGKDLAYRAQKDNQWYVVVNNEKSGPWAYVHLVLYTENGALYSFVKKVEDAKESWLVLKNGKIISTWAYADNVMYLPGAKAIAYRAKFFENGREYWCIVINEEKQMTWDYVDQLDIDVEQDIISYRARDNGIFHMEKIDGQKFNSVEKNADNSQEKSKDAAKEKIKDSESVPAYAPTGGNLYINPEDRVMGKEDAPLTVILYQDFECPYCSAFAGENKEISKMLQERYPGWQPVLPNLIKDYVDPGKVKLVFRHFPLPFHPNTFPAAEAAECAGDQGKFWEMHDKIFALEMIDNEGLANQAEAISLDMEKYHACIKNHEKLKKIQDDKKSGEELGVEGTPSAFVGEKLVSGAVPYKEFKKIIDEVLIK